MIRNLFIKHAPGEPMRPVEQFKFDTQGIIGNAPANPLRQVLIVPEDTLGEFRLNPGDLRENVVVTMSGLHELPSGTVLKMGPALVRLTFHCELCSKITKGLNVRGIKGKRGYLGQFQNSGTVRVGDPLKVMGVQHQPIPHVIAERVELYLRSVHEPIPCKVLLKECGLSPCYARAIPRMLKRMPPEIQGKVIFSSRSSL